MTALVLLDIVLALGAVLRLTRFIVADQIPGEWFIKDPLFDLTTRWRRDRAETITAHGISRKRAPEPWWGRYLEGLSCPFCVSVWMAGAVTVALVLAGGAGDASDWWRYPAGFLALAWLAGHIAALAGDTED